MNTSHFKMNFLSIVNFIQNNKVKKKVKLLSMFLMVHLLKLFNKTILVDKRNLVRENKKLMN